MKICGNCFITKDSDNFYQDKTKKDGYRNQCKECVKLKEKFRIKKSKPEVVSKKCIKCDLEKEIELFSKTRNTCLTCHRQYHNNIVRKSREKIRPIKLVKNKKEKKLKKEKVYVEGSRSIYFRNRRKNDILFKIKDNIGASLRQALNENGYSKYTRTFEILGCSYEDFRKHIEKQFQGWMNWDNHGRYTGNYNETWQLDHIIPLSSSMNEEEILRLHHYTNYQPLCSKINQVDKGARLDFYI
jgi:hypothetical protein